MTPDVRFIAYSGRIAGSGVTNLYVWSTDSGSRVYTNTLSSIVRPVICHNGNRVAFLSSGQLYVADRLVRTNFSIASVANNIRGTYRLSADGEYLAYVAASEPAVAGVDTNGTYDVYLCHMSSGTKRLVSRVPTANASGNSGSDSCDISADGRFVAYRSFATNLGSADTNNRADIFVYDAVADINRLLTAGLSGDGTANGASFEPIFSRDGRTALFSSWASDLTIGDFNNSGDLFSSAFLYVDIRPMSPGPGFLLSWPYAEGTSYKVQYKDDLNAIGWTDLNNAFSVSAGNAVMQDAGGTGNRIYRVIAF